MPRIFWLLVAYCNILYWPPTNTVIDCSFDLKCFDYILADWGFREFKKNATKQKQMELLQLCLFISDCHLAETAHSLITLETQSTALKLPVSWGKLEVRNFRHLAEVLSHTSVTKRVPVLEGKTKCERMVTLCSPAPCANTLHLLLHIFWWLLCQSEMDCSVQC